ncbi:hypothetical protein C1645_838252 [Glomus cerebriforme]|uniref:Uncharacterized protein n=1 Tax=Glomus cerebriforme TaxID=658196 RepID=A0A397SE63_9GLOM|nr:hypothetical protein C1645_838252 [Glomus cerebriforme]
MPDIQQLLEIYISEQENSGVGIVVVVRGIVSGVECVLVLDILIKNVLLWGFKLDPISTIGSYVELLLTSIDSKIGAKSQVAIKELVYEIFHEHKQPSDQTMKDRPKEKLENDEYCASRLQKMHKKGVSFDFLWKDKLYSLMLTANRSKRGYYIRKIKKSLWSTFGINCLKPFEYIWNKLKIKEWKQSKTTRQAHHDLYSRSDPEDDNSDTYITLIIKSVFTADKEHTDANAMWTQVVLESIFDKNHFSMKIDSEVVETWTDTITDLDLYSDEHCKIPPYSPSSNNNPTDNMSLDNDTLDITNVDDVEGVEPSNIGDLY